MDAGAFSDESVVAASKGLELILVDCTVNGHHSQLKTKYGVRGYPTIVFCDSRANKVGQLQGRDSSSVVSQFSDLKQKHALTVPWKKTIEVGLAQAKKDAKPALVFVADEKKKLSPHLESFFVYEELKETLAHFVLVKVDFEKGNEVAEKLSLRGGAVVYILDPGAEDPYKAFAKLRGIKSPAKLEKELKKSLKNWNKAKSKETAGS